MRNVNVRVGGFYLAKVSNQLVTVRVDAIRPVYGHLSSTYLLGSRLAAKTVYDVTNMRTGRKLTFRSARKFRKEVSNA